MLIRLLLMILRPLRHYADADAARCQHSVIIFLSYAMLSPLRRCYGYAPLFRCFRRRHTPLFYALRLFQSGAAYASQDY